MKPRNDPLVRNNRANNFIQQTPFKTYHPKSPSRLGIAVCVVISLKGSFATAGESQSLHDPVSFYTMGVNVNNLECSSGHRAVRPVTETLPSKRNPSWVLVGNDLG